MKPLVIAHRGKHDKYHENTIEAFKEAAKGKFYGIETDVYLTKDNVWVIHHDADCVSSGKKYHIVDHTWNELKNLPLDNEIGHKEARIPLFSDYLKVCKESGKRPIIEIKESPKWKDLKGLVRYVDEYMGIDNVTFIGFYPWPMWKLRRSYGKKIHLQHLVEFHHELIPWSRMHHMDTDIEVSQLYEKTVHKFHKKGLKVNVWTINTREQLIRAIALGADYITTDVFEQDEAI